MPLISIIIPVYNTGEVLKETVASVLNQTFADFELILVDDGSDPATVAVMTGFDDPRIKILRQENQGMAAARNAGLDAAAGEFIALLDHDDLWLPEKLECQLRLFADSPEVGLVYSPAVCFGSEPQELPRFKLLSGAVFADELAQNAILSTSCVLIRRGVLAANCLKFDPLCVPCDDWDLYLRLAAVSEFRCTSRPLVRYRQHGGNVSADVERMYRASIRVLGKLAPELPGIAVRTGIPVRRLRLIYHRHLARMYYGLAWHGAGRPGGLGPFWRNSLLALIHWPLEYRAAALLVRSLGGLRPMR